MPGSGHDPSRRYLLASLLSAALPGAGAAASPSQPARQRLEDFDALWRAIDERYAYFDGRRAEWRRSRQAWRARVSRATGQEQLVEALEAAVASLRDDAVFLSEPSSKAPRRIPEESDLWPVWRGSDARLESVRASSEADAAGLHPGQVVLRIDGVPVEQAVRASLGKQSATPAAREWALRRVLAGPRQGVQHLEVAAGERRRSIDIERHAPGTTNGPALMARRIGEGRDLGYLRIRHGLGEARLLQQLDAAWHHLADTRGMMLDLRDVNRPGGRAATLAILGRFANAEGPWQLRELRGERVADKVAPAADPYRAPLLVLVDRWTAGEGEALASGLRAAAGARLVGTPMAGLHGEPGELRLPHSGVVVHFPVQRALHIDGTPREQLRPDIEIDPSAPSGGPGDPILYQALKLLA